jgi:hypothetical protein
VVRRANARAVGLNSGTSLSLRRHDPDQVQRVTAVSRLKQV